MPRRTRKRHLNIKGAKDEFEEAKKVISMLCKRLNMTEPRLLVTNNRSRFISLTTYSPEKIKSQYIPKYKGGLRIDGEFVVDNWIVVWEPDLSVDTIIHELTHHWLHETGWFENLIEEKTTPTEGMVEIAVKNFSEKLEKCYDDPTKCEGLRVGEKEW